MSKFDKINPKNIILATGIMAVLALFLTNTSSLNGVMALDNPGYTFLDCSYDNDTNKETCCDGPDDNIKCLECDVDLNTGQKSNCKEVPNGREGKIDRNIGSVLDDNMVLQNEPVNQPQPKPQLQGKSPSSLATSK